MRLVRRRRLTVAAVGTAVILGGLVTAGLPPRRFIVDGPSMSPALRPGDIVTTGLLPLRDRLTAPRRFDRWVLASADGTPVIKRIVGLPQETVAVVAGDLVIDGRPLLKGPRLLAAMGSRVAADPASGPPPAAAAGWEWSQAAGEVLDEPPEATVGSLLLMPVRDVGLAAIVRVAGRPAAAGLPVRARVATRVVIWRLQEAGRYALVAGRLDGHLVAAAWRLPTDGAAGGRSCLPAGPPAAWPTAVPWTDALPGDTAATLAIGLGAAAAPAADAFLERAWRWRDVLLRPAPDGQGSWQLPADTVFALGDFPLGSRDSRHWGPLPIGSLRWRINGPDGE